MRADLDKERRILAAESNSLRDQLNEHGQFNEELKYALDRKDVELKDILNKLDEENLAYSAAEKGRRELLNHVAELQEDLESEKEMRKRIDGAKIELSLVSYT